MGILRLPDVPHGFFPEETVTSALQFRDNCSCFFASHLENVTGLLDRARQSCQNPLFLVLRYEEFPSGFGTLSSCLFGERTGDDNKTHAVFHNRGHLTLLIVI